MKRLFSYGLDVAEAQDVAQEAFIVLLNRVRDGVAIASPKAYLFGIASKIAARHTVGRYREILTDQIGEDYVPAAQDATSGVIEQQDILRMIQTLPPTQRTIMMLACDGFQATEISEILGVPDATVRSNFRHARKTLREKFLLEENQ